MISSNREKVYAHRAGRVARNLLGRMRRSPRVDQDGEGDPAVRGALLLPGGGGGRIAGAFRRGRAAARPEGVRPESGSGSISSHETEDPPPALPLRGGPSRRHRPRPSYPPRQSIAPLIARRHWHYRAGGGGGPDFFPDQCAS